MSLKNIMKHAAPRLRRAVGSMRAARLDLAVVIIACGFSFGLRYYYVFETIDVDGAFQQISGDPEDYLRIAYTLSQIDYFAEPAKINVKESLIRHQHPVLASAADVRQTAWRPPLWPLVLACMMRVTNYDLSRMLYLRFAIDLLTLVLFYRLLLHLNLHCVSRAVALLLLAVHPAWLIYAGTFFSEPLTLFVHVAFALSLLSLLRDRQSWLRATLAGVFAGLTILEHPFYLFFPLLLTGLIYATRLVRAGNALLLLTMMCLVVSPWLARNMLLFHTMRPILTTSAGLNLAKGWNPAFLGLYRDTTADVVLSERVIGAEDVKESGKSEEEKSEAYTERAVGFAETNWRLIPAIVARKAVGAVNPFPETARGGVLEAGRAAFQILSFLPLLFVIASRRAGKLRLLAAALSAAYLLMSILMMGTIRYRFPLIWVELLSVVWVCDWWVHRVVAGAYGKGGRLLARAARRAAGRENGAGGAVAAPLQIQFSRRALRQDV